MDRLPSVAPTRPPDYGSALGQRHRRPARLSRQHDVELSFSAVTVDVEASYAVLPSPRHGVRGLVGPALFGGRGAI